MSKTMRINALAYNVINNNITKNKMLRDENTLVVKILEELEVIKLDEEKINYLYYEWFNKEAATNAYTLLVKSIKKDYTDKHREFYSLLNMLTVKK